MVATPNQGSLLARFAFGMDLLDHLVPDAERSKVSRFYAAIEDGLSEATVDLQPDSTFLRQLNARDRNPNVRYTIFLGTGGHFTRRQVDELREGLATAKSKSDVVGLLAPRIDETLADLDEVIRGLGDGVVAVKRGRARGRRGHRGAGIHPSGSASAGDGNGGRSSVQDGSPAAAEVAWNRIHSVLYPSGTLPRVAYQQVLPMARCMRNVNGWHSLPRNLPH